MYQISIINMVRSWERRLEIEEEQRKNGQYRPSSDFEFSFERRKFEWLPMLKQMAKSKNNYQPTQLHQESTCCQEDSTYLIRADSQRLQNVG